MNCFAQNIFKMYSCRPQLMSLRQLGGKTAHISDMH